MPLNHFGTLRMAEFQETNQLVFIFIILVLNKNKYYGKYATAKITKKQEKKTKKRFEHNI